ncbi:MAG: peptidoglycan recognition family protein [Clostridia bacterium]
MIKSNLTSVVVEAHSSNYTQGRKGYKVCKITPHHMAGVLSAEGCGRIFQNANRNASANYGIGNDGKIACYVGEENRAWTSSSSSNDCQAITIEVSNSSVGGNYPISAAAWNSLVALCVDICKRYGFRLNYDGTPNGSLTRHNMFANTNCPGAYLQSKFPDLVKEVNAKLDGNIPATPSTTSTNNSYLVKVTASALNIRQGIGTGTPVVGCIRDKGTYTIVETSGNWGKLKSGAGWICLDYTTKVNGGTVVSNTISSFSKGQKVTLKTSASKYCTGQTIPSFIKGKTYTIMQVGSGNTHPNGVLLKEIMSWVYKVDVQ